MKALRTGLRFDLRIPKIRIRLPALFIFNRTILRCQHSNRNSRRSRALRVSGTASDLRFAIVPRHPWHRSSQCLLTQPRCGRCRTRPEFFSNSTIRSCILQSGDSGNVQNIARGPENKAWQSPGLETQSPPQQSHAGNRPRIGHRDGNYGLIEEDRGQEFHATVDL